MTREDPNPYAPPAQAALAAPPPVRKTHYLTRFWLLALVNAATTFVFAKGLHKYCNAPLSTGWSDYAFRAFWLVLMSTLVTTGCASISGLILRRTWGWYATVLHYIAILLLCVIGIVRGIFLIRQHGDWTHFKDGVWILGVALALLWLMLTNKTRQALCVRWPRWLVP